MKTNPHQLNQQVLELIASKQNGYTADDIRLMAQYEGGGGMAKYGGTFDQYGQGLLNEFYTPLALVKKMVGLAIHHGFNDGPVLEPSCGTGRFLRFFSPQVEIDAFEIDNTSYQIAKHSFPHANIQQIYFESIFTDRRKALPFTPKYRLVIGNPPYGQFKGRYAPLEKKATGAQKVEEYFITRGLDLLLPQGLLIYVIGTEPKNGGVPFLRQGGSAVKKRIARQAELIDAYRLPAKMFPNTEVLTEIVVFRKK